MCLKILFHYNLVDTVYLKLKCDFFTFLYFDNRNKHFFEIVINFKCNFKHAEI